MKRTFFYAAFVLCAVLVFAADDSKPEPVSTIRIYHAKDTPVPTSASSVSGISI